MQTETVILERKINIYEEQLKKNKTLEITMTGNSMLPFLKNGQVVLIDPVQISDLKIGDIVLAHFENRLLCHRIFTKKKDSFRTKADAFFKLDPPMTKDNLMGKVVAYKYGNNIMRIDKDFFRFWGWVISRATLFPACFYPMLRWLKMMILENKNQKILDNLIFKLINLDKLKNITKIYKESIFLQAKICEHIFLPKVYAQGVAGVIFYNLKKRELFSLLPQGIVSALKEDYLNNSGRALLIKQSLTQVLKSLNQEKADVILIRGADFMINLYPEMGMRVMSDLDLVIKSDDFLKISAVFKKLGFSNPQGYKYLLSREGIYYDLHLDCAGFWRITSRNVGISIKNQQVWQSAQKYSGELENIRTLDVYDSILSCAAHLQEHSYARLIWFYDIALLINNHEYFDWNLLLIKAWKFKLTKQLFFVLKYLENVKFTGLPAGAAEELDKVRLNFYERKSLKMLLANRRDLICGELLHLFSLPNLTQRIKCIKETIFIKENDFSQAGRINFLDYIARFFRISGYCLNKMTIIFRR